MVKVDFDRIGLDTNWDWAADVKKHSHVLPRGVSPKSTRTPLLDDTVAYTFAHSINLDAVFTVPKEEDMERAPVTEEQAPHVVDEVGKEGTELGTNHATEAILHPEQVLVEDVPEVVTETTPTNNTTDQQVSVSEAVPSVKARCFSWLQRFRRLSLVQATTPAEAVNKGLEHEVVDKDLANALQESASMQEASEVSMAEARAQLQCIMDPYNAKPRQVEADGNCQFRALAQQLYGDESLHQSIRLRAVQQLTAAPEAYSDFVHEPFDEYISRMSRDGQWGDNVTLQAASDMLGANIHILTNQPGAEHLQVHPSSITKEENSTSLWLAFLAEVHYDAVDFVPDDNAPTTDKTESI